MRFNDIYTNTAERYSMGIDENTGEYYILILVSNRMADYEEYYKISDIKFRQYLNKSGGALDFVGRCKNRREDDLLILQPGIDCGVAG